jgi:hypothetical protein
LGMACCGWLVLRAGVSPAQNGLLEAAQACGILVVGISALSQVSVPLLALGYSLAAGCTLSLLVALGQRLQGGTPAAVRGLAPGRPPYGIALAAALPVLLTMVMRIKRRHHARVLSFVATLLALLSCFHLPSFLLCCTAALGSGLLFPARRVRSAVFAGLATGILAAAAIPSQRSALVRSIANTDSAGHARRHTLERIAAFRAIRARPLVGRGPGTYQSTVSSAEFRKGLDETRENVVETGSQPGYLVLAVEYGIPGALLLIALLIHALWVGHLFRSGHAHDNSEGTPVRQAATYGLAVLLVGGFFTPLLVRGTGALMAILTGTALAASPNQKAVRGVSLPSPPLWFQAVSAASLLLCAALLASHFAPAPRPALTAETPPVAGQSRFDFEAEALAPLPECWHVVPAPQASGGMALAVPDMDNSELNGAAGVHARFDLLEAATYESWFRVLWKHGCANSVLVQVDDRPASMVGNDGTYGVWQWIAGPTFTLQKGGHQLTLAPREALVRVDRIILSTPHVGAPEKQEPRPPPLSIPALPPWNPAERQPRPAFLAAIGGVFQPGAESLLVQLGVPYVRLSDHELADTSALARYDLVWISRVVGDPSPVFKAVGEFVKSGGTAFLEEMVDDYGRSSAAERELVPGGRLARGPTSTGPSRPYGVITVQPAGSPLLTAVEDGAKVYKDIPVAVLRAPKHDTVSAHGALWRGGRKIGPLMITKQLGKGHVYAFALPLAFTHMWRGNRFAPIALDIIKHAIGDAYAPLFETMKCTAPARTDGVRFADDFMRKRDEPGPWTVEAGELTATGAPAPAPPRYSRRRRPKGPEHPFTACLSAGASVRAGQEEWEHFRVSAALLTDAGEGGVWTTTSAGRRAHLLFDAREGRLRLTATADGQERTLAEVDDVPGPNTGWRRLSLMKQNSEWQGWLDGICRLRLPVDREHSVGPFGLTCRSGQVQVDDVQVRNVANVVNGTDRCPGEEGSSRVDSSGLPGVEPHGIYAPQWFLQPDRLGRHGVTLALPLFTPGAFVFDDDILGRIGPAPSGTFVGFPDSRMPEKEVNLISSSWRDYHFRGQLVDWYGTGAKWHRRSRWACDQQWEWLGTAATHRPTILWHRTPLKPPYAISVLCAPAMRGRRGFDEKERDLNLVLGGDGHSLDTGFTLRTGPTGSYGCQLFHAGQATVSAPNIGLPPQGGFTLHHRWLWLHATVEANRIRFSFDGRPALDYRAEAEIPSGFVGFWTQNNSVQVARITIAGSE